MPIVDISGAFDLHLHSNPSLFPRIGDDIDLARHASETGLAGLLIKNHFESTVGRAALCDRACEGVRVFGGLVLNQFTGGINPAAVETSLKLGARQIWMPTLDSAAHEKVYGHTGGFGYQESGAQIPRKGLTIIDDSGDLTGEAQTIVELVRDAGAILGTAHLDRTEIFQLARFSQKAGFTGLLITHPYFPPPALKLADQVELAQMGATLEFCGGNLYPIPGIGRIEEYRESVARVGAGSIILTSDAGQPRKSLPAEVLRVFTQCLLEKGISQEEINVMTKENPARLLGL